MLKAQQILGQPGPDDGNGLGKGERGKFEGEDAAQETTVHDALKQCTGKNPNRAGAKGTDKGGAQNTAELAGQSQPK